MDTNKLIMKTQTITKVNLKAIYDDSCSYWKKRLEDYARRNPFDSEVELTQSEIDEMYNESDDKQKVLLDKFFTRDLSIMDRVNSFEDACKLLGLVFNPKYDLVDEIAFKKLKVIVKALNEGWYPDWENENEAKYYVYWTMHSSFSYFNTNCYYNRTDVQSTLLLKNKKLAEHAAKIAYQEYKDFYL